MGIEKSEEIWKRAKMVIPGGANTLSKYYGRVPMGIAPPTISHGSGCMIYDYDGNAYIDWSGALGPVVLGYDVISPVTAKVLLPMTNKSEVELAEKLVEIIPCAEMVRFFKSGSECTTAAVRLARAITGRQNVLCCGYHGWHDWYAKTLPDKRRGGIPSHVYGLTLKLDYGDLEQLESRAIDFNPACFILEPMSRLCPEKASKEYLQEVRQLCEKYGIILIFDEIIMGFRYAMAGGQEYYGVVPDLACFSKGMANGWPIAALVGDAYMMRELEHMQVSGTFCGELQSVCASLKTIEFMEREDVIRDISKKGEYLNMNIREMILSYVIGNRVRLKGFGPWSSLVWANINDEMYFLQEIFRAGIFYSRDHFVMHSHSYDDIEKTLGIYGRIFSYMAVGEELKIECSIDKELF